MVKRPIPPPGGDRNSQEDKKVGRILLATGNDFGDFLPLAGRTRSLGTAKSVRGPETDKPLQDQVKTGFIKVVTV